MRGKINLMAGGAENGQKLVNFLFRERVVANFAKVAEIMPGVAARAGEGWVTESVLGTLLSSAMSGDGLGFGDVAGGAAFALGKRAIGRRAGVGNAKIQREIAAILTESDPARLQKLLERSTKSGETSAALKYLAVASERLAQAGSRVGPMEQQAAERVDPQLGYINAQPGYARGGTVEMPRDTTVEMLEHNSDLYSPRLGVTTATPLVPSLQELLALREVEPRKRKGSVGIVTKGEGTVALRDGGLVEADHSPGRDAYLHGEGAVDQPDERNAFDIKGRSTAPLRTKGPAANSRRDTVGDRTRQRLRPERMRAQQVTPAVDARRFWTDLQAAITDHASQRGIDIAHMEWPSFEDDVPVLVEEAVEVAVEPKAKGMPPKGALDEDTFKHGHSVHGARSLTYKSWRGLLRRYGDWVCVQWRADFMQFVADVGERPNVAHHLRVIDTSLPILPFNVRWEVRRRTEIPRNVTRAKRRVQAAEARMAQQQVSA